jgi:hypothetical protein
MADPTNISIPKAWLEHADKLKEKREEDPQFKNLIKQKSEQTLGQLSDKKIKDPRLLVKNLKEVQDTLNHLTGQNVSQLKAKLTPFINDVILPSYFKKIDITVPVEKQKELITDSVAADPSGLLLSKLTDAFTEKYSPISEQEKKLKEYRLTGKRAFNIAARLKKIAARLSKIK